MKLKSYPQSRQENIVIQELNNEILIYDLNKNKAFCLNETSAKIWQECDGKKSVAEISQILSRKLKFDISENIVWLALNQFKTDNLLAESRDLVTPFDGLNRREIVKRIGFASMVALPIISAVVAPSALHAQSGLCGGFVPPTLNCVPGNSADLSDDGCPCTGNPECAGVCPVSNGPRFCAGGNTGPFCAPGNDLDLSQDCCPCTGNPECIGVCPITPPGIPRVCAGGAP